jgi:hypothetical protein
MRRLIFIFLLCSQRINSMTFASTVYTLYPFHISTFVLFSFLSLTPKNLAIVPLTAPKFLLSLVLTVIGHPLKSFKHGSTCIIGPQGTSICSQGPRISRIPYKSGQFFWDILFVVKKTPCKKHPKEVFLQHEFFNYVPPTTTYIVPHLRTCVKLPS